MTFKFNWIGSAGWQRLWRQHIGWSESLAIFIGVRLGLTLLAFMAWFLYPQNSPEFIPNPNYLFPELSLWDARLLGVWGNWDGRWYLKIAEHGYHSDPNTLAFFPLYPLLMCVVGKFLGGNYLVAGLLISNGMTAIAMILLQKLVHRDFDAELARQTVFYLALFPTAFYLYAIYTEALFLALVLGAFGAARTERWWWAGVMVTLATLTRSLGIFLVLPLAWEWWRHHRVKRKHEPNGLQLLWLCKLFFFSRFVIMLGLPLLAFGCWQFYAGRLFDSVGAVIKVQSQWGRAFEWPWNTVLQSFQVILSSGTGWPPVLDVKWKQPHNLTDFLFVIVGLAILALGSWLSGQRQLPLSYLLYQGVGLMLPLTAPNSAAPLVSCPRYMLVLFPMFIILAQLGRRWRWVHFLYIYVALSLQSILFMRFANAFWVA